MPGHQGREAPKVPKLKPSSSEGPWTNGPGRVPESVATLAWEAELRGYGPPLLERGVLMVAIDKMHVEEPKPSWRILGSEAELREALGRALAFEDAIARDGETRADRYAWELAHVKPTADPEGERVARAS
jgi:hypothetical protein